MICSLVRFLGGEKRGMEGAESLPILGLFKGEGGNLKHFCVD